MDDLSFKAQHLVIEFRLLESPAWSRDAPHRSGDQMALYKRKGTNNYLIDFTAPDGRRVRESAGTADYEAARRFEAQLLLQHDAGEVFDIRPSQALSLQGLVDKFLAYQLKVHPRSMSTYYVPATQAFTRWAGPDRQVSSITLQDIQNFCADRTAIHSVVTANRNLAVLKSMFTLAADWGILKTSPAKKAKQQREPEGRRFFLSPFQQQALLVQAQEPIRSLLLVALRTGMRRSELLRLRPRDVDFTMNLIHVTGTKTDTTRTIPLLPEVKAIFLRLASEIPEDQKLFRSGHGSGYNMTSVSQIFRKVARRAGLQEVHFHDLRHTFASDLLAARVELPVIAELLGHKNIKTTQRYAHLDGSRTRQAMADLGGYLATQLKAFSAQSES